MGRYSELCDIIHLIGPDLDFCRETKHPKDSSMDTLIAIELRNSNIIFYLFDQRSIIFMDNSQYHITICYGFGDDPIG
jgi:hypothetical protein